MVYKNDSSVDTHKNRHTATITTTDYAITNLFCAHHTYFPYNYYVIAENCNRAQQKITATICDTRYTTSVVPVRVRSFEVEEN